MTFNINGDGGVGDNGWPRRSELVLKTLLRYSPDLIGLQEAMDGNLSFLKENLPGYDSVEGNRYGDNPPLERTSIFWKADRYELLETGEFWFSETPDVESSGWGVPYPMGATWVTLRCHATDDAFVHVNTHFEDGDEAEPSRVNASRHIIERMQSIGRAVPVIATGDFNCNPWSKPYQLFREAGYSDAYRSAGNADNLSSSSYHGFKGRDYFALEWGGEMFWRVDWILSRDGAGRVQTISCDFVRDAEPPTYPSDHYPVVSEFVII